MTESLPPCPYGRKGKHTIGVILPDTAEYAAVLFCDSCGITRHVTLSLPIPLDDLPSDAIAHIARGR